MCMYEKEPQIDITFTKYHITGMDFTHTHCSEHVSHSRHTRFMIEKWFHGITNKDPSFCHLLLNINAL